MNHHIQVKMSSLAVHPTQVLPTTEEQDIGNQLLPAPATEINVHSYMG